MSQDPNMNLPVKTGDDFIGELETMDLSELKKGQQFMVSVSNGDRNGVTYVSSAQRGPFTFEEMCEAVGVMWKEHQHHAKVVICEKDFTKDLKYLDENTIDYIEAHFQDIITESMLDGVFDEIKDYTCRAGVNIDSGDDNPLSTKNVAAKQETKVEDEEEDDLI